MVWPSGSGIGSSWYEKLRNSCGANSWRGISDIACRTRGSRIPRLRSCVSTISRRSENQSGSKPHPHFIIEGMAHQITLIPGDGIGPEVAEATVRAVDATGVSIDWERVEAGARALVEQGQLIPD